MNKQKNLSNLNRRELNAFVNVDWILDSLGIEKNRQGKIYSPYNVEKVPSCLINTKDGKLKNTFKDFSSGNHGDIIQLVMDVKNIDEKAAMKYCIREMKNRGGIIVNNFNKQKRNTKTHSTKLTSFEQGRYDNYVNGEIASGHSASEAKKKIIHCIKFARKVNRDIIYKDIQRFCKKTGFSVKTKKYLLGKERNLKTSSIGKYGLFEVSDPKKLKQYLKNKNSDNQLATSGIFNEDGKIIFPPNCIVIPHYYKKKIEYLTIRTIGDQNSKYKNLCNTYDDLSPKRLFNKDVLKHLKEGESIYVFEGIFDTIIADQLKLKAIGVLGTNNIPLEQIKELTKKYKVRLALDNDRAGNEAAQKIVDYCQRPLRKLVFSYGKDLTDVYGQSRNRIGKNPYIKIIELRPNHFKKNMSFRKIYTMSAKEIMKLNMPERNWIVPNFLFAGLALITGRPKHGKSCLAFDFANAVAGRKRFLKKYNCDKGKVLYISYEEGVDDFKDRIQNSLKNNCVPDNIIFTYELYKNENGKKVPWLTFPKLQDGGFELLEDLLKKNRDIKMVILDPYGKTMPSSKNSTDNYKTEYEFIGKLQEIALKYKISILVVHHDKKGGASSPDELILGSTAIAAAADILIALRKNGDDGVLHIYGRGIKDKKYPILMNNGSWELSTKKIVEQWLTPEQAELFSHFKKSDKFVFQTKQVERLVNKSGANVSKMLKALVKKGLIKNTSYGKYRLAPISS